MFFFTKIFSVNLLSANQIAHRQEYLLLFSGQHYGYKRLCVGEFVCVFV